MIGDLVDQSYASGGPLVPVVEWVVDQAVTAHQPVVDGPGVNANAGQVRLRSDGLAQSDQQIPVQLEDVPVQPVCDPDRVVGKAMHRLNAQLVWAEVAEHHPAACGAKINSGHPSAGHCVPFDRLRAQMRAEPVEARSLT